VEKAVPGMLYLVLKYAETPADAILASVNLGGDSCHRSAIVGGLAALMIDLSSDSNASNSIISEWKSELNCPNDFAEVVQCFAELAVMHTQRQSGATDSDLKLSQMSSVSPHATNVSTIPSISQQNNKPQVNATVPKQDLWSSNNNMPNRDVSVNGSSWSSDNSSLLDASNISTLKLPPLPGACRS